MDAPTIDSVIGASCVNEGSVTLSNLPGGTFTINANGIQDSGEPNFIHGHFNYEINGDGNISQLSPSLGSTYLYDNDAANSYDIDYSFDNSDLYYSVGNSGYQDVNVAAGSGITSYNFPIIVAPHDDVLVSAVSVGGQPRPGSFYTVRVKIQNLGTQTASGTLIS